MSGVGPRTSDPGPQTLTSGFTPALGTPHQKATMKRQMKKTFEGLSRRSKV
jgi:hypothetical protein